jgi:hypothetical protein
MSYTVGGPSIQQLMSYEVTKVILLKTVFEREYKLQSDSAVVCCFIMLENMPTGWWLTT